MKRIAIVGATGLVGREIIHLCESYFDQDTEYILYASEKSEGSKVKVNNTELTVKLLSQENIEEVDLAMFSAGGERSKEFADDFINKGSYVVDNSSAFRSEKDIPLIVYGVNEEVISKKDKLIANPNCTTMILVMALKPMHNIYKLEKIVPVSYQAVSGSGIEATNSLIQETRLGEGLDANYQKGYYGRPIANNVIPLAGALTDNGYSEEEMKFLNESRKILEAPDLIVEPSNARVGVKTGHGIFCSATFSQDVDLNHIIKSIEDFPGIEHWEEKLPTPLDAEGSENVYISRIRKGLSSDKIVNFWVVGDNLLKGAALNTVQIGNHLLNL